MNTVVVACAAAGQLLPDVQPDFEFDDLCRTPNQLGVLGGVERLVLILQAGKYDLPEVQRAARMIDVDPLGLQIIEVDEASLNGSFQADLAGVVARASKFEGSVPEHAKPLAARVMTRRGFLRPLAPAYVAAPFIDPDICVSSDGCMACVEECPREAYEWRSGQIEYDMDVCVTCGRCVTVCPVGAIGDPSATPAMLEAQVRAAVDASAGPIGIRFVCSSGSMAADADWVDVVVPCSSMVTGTWILGCLLLGAAGATAVPCAQSGCSLGLDDRAIEVNDLASAVLEDVGLDPQVVTGTSLGEIIGVSRVEGLFDHDAAPRVIEVLVSATSGSIDVDDPAADLGIVEISSAACTLCGQCVKTCPTDALMESFSGEEFSITFDPRLCVNCSQCLRSCPEIVNGAITVTGSYNSEALAGDRRILNGGQFVRCQVCGEEFAPMSMMSRISEVLGPEFDATMSVVGSRCLDCRGR